MVSLALKGTGIDTSGRNARLTAVLTRPKGSLVMKSIFMIATIFGGFATAADIGTDSGRPGTFSRDIAPILQERCQECHHQGGMAPMSLVTYEETRPWAKSIRQRVVTRQMPPWHIDMTVGVRDFKNDMSLF